VVVGYLIAWVVRKARRAGGRLDAEVDAAVDAGLDRLHEVVSAKLGADPAWLDLRDEAAATGQVSRLTGQRVKLSLDAAATKDRPFAEALVELVGRLQAVESPGATAVGAGSTAVAGDVDVRAESGSVAAWTITGGVHLEYASPSPAASPPDPLPPDPPVPGRSRD
jgi:hypothetical protein